MDEEQDESSMQQEMRAIQQWKQKRKEARRWASQPSKAPLHSQESCVVC